MGKVFETQKDRDIELKIIRKIAGSNKIIKLPKEGLDYEIEGKAFIEIKRYHINSDQFRYTMVSLIKLVKLQKYSRKLPTYLFIQFNDKLKYINVNQISGKIEQRGRAIKRAGSSNDREIICHIDNYKFITFNPQT
jgi:hypothetical protein